LKNKEYEKLQSIEVQTIAWLGYNFQLLANKNNKKKKDKYSLNLVTTLFSSIFRGTKPQNSQKPEMLPQKTKTKPRKPYNTETPNPAGREQSNNEQ
jgi:hypothetical protein